MHFVTGRYVITWNKANSHRIINELPCRMWGNVEKNVAALLRQEGVSNIRVFDNNLDKFVGLPEWMWC